MIEGLEGFLKDADAAAIQMGVTSAGILFNIDFVPDGLNIRHYFDVIISAESVKESKPHPEIFLMAAELMGVPSPECLVFLDTPKGVEAASKEGMRCVVITGLHQPGEFAQYGNIIYFTGNFNRLAAMLLPSKPIAAS